MSIAGRIGCRAPRRGLGGFSWGLGLAAPAVFTQQQRDGAAMKMADEVPTTMPNSITQAKPDNVGGPNKVSSKAARKTVAEVR